MQTMSKKKMRCIGLSGVIGSGKSTLISLLKEKQIPVLDCDQINAELLQIGEEGYTQIKASFTQDLWNEDGSLNKVKMSQHIFSNPKQKEKLEAILHPLIKQEILSRLENLKGFDLAVVEVPLLFEVKWETFFDEVWVVASSEENRIYRLKTYRNISEEEAKRRMKYQMPLEEKIAKADKVFYNDGDISDLKKQLETVLIEMRG